MATFDFDFQRFASLLPPPGLFFATPAEQEAIRRACLIVDALAIGPDGVQRGFDEVLAGLSEERRGEITELSLSSGADGFYNGPHVDTGAVNLSRCTFLRYLKALPNLTAVEILNVKWRACGKESEAGHRCQRPQAFPKITMLILDRIEMVAPFDDEPIALVRYTPRLHLLKLGRMDIPPYQHLRRGPLPPLPASLEQLTAVFPTHERWGLHSLKPSPLDRLSPNFPAVSWLELRDVDKTSGALVTANATIAASRDTLRCLTMLLTPRAQDENGSHYAEMAIGTCRSLKTFSVALEITVGQHNDTVPLCTCLSALLARLPLTVTEVRIGLMLLDDTPQGTLPGEGPRLRALERVTWRRVAQHLRRLPLEKLVVSGVEEMRVHVENKLNTFVMAGKFMYHQVY